MQAPRNTLRQRDFIIVLLGQVISLFGNAILRFALPLHLLRATGSAALFGSVSALSFAPMVVLSLLGGVLADRVDKRNVMVALDALVALLCGAFLLVMDELSIAAAFTSRRCRRACPRFCAARRSCAATPPSTWSPRSTIFSDPLWAASSSAFGGWSPSLPSAAFASRPRQSWRWR